MSVPWKKSYDKPRQYIKKQRYHFAHKDSYNQSYGFSSIIYRCELGRKEGWVQKFHSFELYWRRLDGEGDGISLQYSCLENPMDRGAWWAAVYVFAQSRTRLKRLSSSSRLLRIPWTARRSNQSILKEINPKYSLEGLMLKLQYFGHLMWRADWLEKTLMLGKLRAREWGDRGWDGWMTSLTQWTWVWTNSGR